VVIAFGSFPVGAVVGPPFCSFCVFSTVISTQVVHLGPPPKGTTTRLKATARAPLGVASRGGAVWPHFAVRLRVLVQIQPPRGAGSLVCVLLSKTKPLPVTPTRLPLQSNF
jgi:hypothetical protein